MGNGSSDRARVSPTPGWGDDSTIELSMMAAAPQPIPSAGAPTPERPDLDALIRAVPLSRMLDYGVPLPDAEVFRARVSSGGEWLEVGRALAAAHEQGSAAALAGGLTGLAAAQLNAAASLRLVAQLAVYDRRPDHLELYLDGVDDFIEAARVADDDMTEARTDGPGGTVHTWVLPSRTARPAPAVLVWGGTSGWGPVYRRLGESLRAAGLTVVLTELPGQGLSRLRSRSHLTMDFVGSLSRTLNELTDHPAVNGTFGVLGNSLGGLLAAHFASAESRIRSACLNGGIVDPAVPAVRYARQSALWRLTLGVDEAADLTIALAPFRYEPARRPIDCATLVLHGDQDPLVTVEDARTFLGGVRSRDRLLVRFPDGEHCLYNRAGERDALVAQWFARTLGSAPSTGE